MRTSNPVLRREIVERWRSRRAPMTLTIYLTLLGLIMYGLYRVGAAVLRAGFGFGFDAATAGPVLGRFLVEGLFFFVLLLVLFVGPGYAAAQISGERERRTLTLLQVTLLRPVQIVLGKLGASVAWLTLLIVAAIPIGAVAFFLGGIGIADLVRGLVTLIVIAVSVAAMALGISSMTKRTTGSIVLTYGAVLALTLGTFFLAGVEAIVRATNGRDVRTPVALYLNPFFGLADAVTAADIESGPGLPSPLGVIALTLPGSSVMQEAGGAAVSDDGEVMVAPAVPARGDMVAPGARGTGVKAVPMPIDGEQPARIRVKDIKRKRARAVATAKADAGTIDAEAGTLEAEVAIDAVEQPPDFEGPPGAPVPLPAAPQEPGRRPVWLIVLLLYSLLGGLGLLVATRRLRVTEPRTRAGVAPVPPPGAGPLAPAPGVAPPPAAAGWERDS